MTQFDIRLEALGEAQTAVEWSLPGEQLDADIEEAAGICDRARAARIRAVRAVTYEDHKVTLLGVRRLARRLKFTLRRRWWQHRW